MNPGPVEEAGQTARSLIDALRSNPATLTLIVANVALLVFFFFALKGGAEFRDLSLRNQYELMRETSQLLSKCVVPGGGTL
jgi:hypothetical protein